MTIKDHAKQAEHLRVQNLNLQKRTIKMIKFQYQYRRRHGEYLNGITISELCDQLRQLQQEAKHIAVLTG